MWEIVSATGEWAGAIVVVASLLYLARQIKQTNEQSRAAARYSFLNAYGLANAAIGEDNHSADVFSRGMRSAELDEGEHMQFVVLLGQFFNTWSVMFDLHQEGQLPESQWKVVRTDIKAVLQTPGGFALWNDTLVHNYDGRFVSFVSSLRASGENTFDILKGGLAQET
jgi:hypothetical protein